MKIAIVGGAGRMGTWIARFLLTEGMEVILVDNDETRLAAACRELKTEGKTDLGAVRAANVIVVAVPIARFEQTVNDLSHYVRKGQAVVDITSVKAMPVEVMHRYLGGCLVLGAHPVFGPGASGLEGHNIVLTPISDIEKNLAEQAKTFLEERGARVELMTPAEHDKLMAVVLGLAHFVAIVSGDTLLSLDNLADMELTGGVTFKVLLTLVASVLSEDPSLYASVQTNLPELPAVEAEFIRKAAQWAELVKQKDSPEFVRRMAELRRKLEQTVPGANRAYRDMYHIAEGR